MKDIFVTKKEFIIKDVDNKVRSVLTWKGKWVVSKRELLDILIFNAEQTIKDKNLKEEIEKELAEYELCKMNKKEIKRLLTYIKFDK